MPLLFLQLSYLAYDNDLFFRKWENYIITFNKYIYKIRLNNFVRFLESLQKICRKMDSNIILLTIVIILFIWTQGHTPKTSSSCEVLLNEEIKCVLKWKEIFWKRIMQNFVENMSRGTKCIWNYQRSFLYSNFDKMYIN